MKTRTFLSALLVILFATLMGCATMETAKHSYFMRGSVLEVSDGNAYICLGTDQGAKVGQELKVQRYVKTGVSPKGGAPTYKIETVGTLKITETESHMANAKILNGDVKENDVVDLNP